MADKVKESHVDAVIARYARGRTITQIERDAGLREGSLGFSLRPSQRGRIPRQPIQERFAEALGAPLGEISLAFALDNGAELTAEAELNERAKRLLDDYALMTRTEQRMLEDLARVTADRHRAQITDCDKDQDHH